MIEVGMTHTVEKTVTADMTAKAVGSGGLEVLGTPYMMGLMECAAMWCVQNELPEGKGTVGVDIASSHLAPTPVGMKITATAEVTGVSANGKMITFKITASDEEGLIGEVHLRRRHRQRPLPAEVQRQAGQGQVSPYAANAARAGRRSFPLPCGGTPYLVQ